MPHFKIPQASYRNGELYPAGSIVESEIHEATTGSRLTDAKGNIIPGVKPLTKEEISIAAEKFRADAAKSGESVTAAAEKLSVLDAIADGADEGVAVDDDGEPKAKGKKAKKPADV